MLAYALDPLNRGTARLVEGYRGPLPGRHSLPAATAKARLAYNAANLMLLTGAGKLEGQVPGIAARHALLHPAAVVHRN